MTKYVLTVDVGSIDIRAALIRIEDWAIVSSARRVLPIRRTNGGAALSFLVGKLRTHLFECLFETIKSTSVPSRNIMSLSVTSQRAGGAFLDSDGRTLHAAPNRDVRAVFEGAAIDSHLLDLVYATTGHLPSMLFTPAKLHWWRTHYPQVHAKVATVLSLASWVVHELTGKVVETPTMLTETGLGNVSNGKPAVEMLSALDVHIKLIPRIIEEGTVVATLTHEAANSIGVRDNLPVILAGPDAQLAALGTGCSTVGDTVITAGWSSPVQRILEKPQHDTKHRTWVVRLPVMASWASEANAGDIGGTRDVVRRMLSHRMTHKRFSELAKLAPLDDRAILASWGPKALDLSNPGMSLGGLITPSPVTYEGIESSQLARATIQNITFAIRECIELLDQVCGDSAGPVGLTGGMARDDFFVKLLATTIGRPIRRHGPNGSAIGAAMIGSLPRSGWLQAAEHIVSLSHVIYPDNNVGNIDEQYRRWLKLRNGLDALAEGL